MRRIVLLLMFLSVPAFAESPEDMIAHGHHDRGAQAYEEGRYADALREFEAAHTAEPLPAFDYNVARCLERLGRQVEALAAYERYLTVAPSAGNAEDVRKRVTLLRHEIAEHPTVAAARMDSSPTHRWVASGVTGGIALAFAAVGGGLLGSAASSYHGLSSSCSPNCDPSAWQSLPAREHAGEALLGVAAAIAVVDIALIVRAARRK